MAMAAAAAATTLWVASPSSSLCAGASSKCMSTGSRVEFGPSVCTWAPVKAAAGCRENVAVMGTSSSSSSSSRSSSGSRSARRGWRWRAVAEQLQAETEESSEEGFSSDTISIFFEAEGALPEASVAKLTATLEDVEGVSDIAIMASPDGTCTVKLIKQMNVQATGVASGLVEVLLKGGFKLQALNLGFDEDDGDDEDLYDYDVSSSTEEAGTTE